MTMEVNLRLMKSRKGTGDGEQSVVQKLEDPEPTLNKLPDRKECIHKVRHVPLFRYLRRYASDVEKCFVVSCRDLITVHRRKLKINQQMASKVMSSAWPYLDISRLMGLSRFVFQQRLDWRSQVT